MEKTKIWISSIVHEEQRSSFYLVLVGVWFIVAVYAILHDQYLVRIAPEHFTVYHPNPHHISSAPLLAAYLALLASVSPGIVLGIASWFAGRSGTYPKLSPGQIFRAVLMVIGITEILAAISGGIVFFTGTPLYPETPDPDLTIQLVITQTIQITCYLVAMISSVIMLCWMVYKRRHLVTEVTQNGGVVHTIKRYVKSKE